MKKKHKPDLERFPTICFRGCNILMVECEYIDDQGKLLGKKKPFGVDCCELIVSNYPSFSEDCSELFVRSEQRKSVFAIFFQKDWGGKQAYFSARWKTKKGEVGPWSPFVNCTVPYSR
jgi:hypothetical protein